MPMLVVVPESVAVMIKGQHNNFDVLTDINSMLRYLAPADIAEIFIATQDFKFNYDFLATSSFYGKFELALQDDMHESFARRLRKRYDSLMLENQAKEDEAVVKYTLYTVSESLWVAVSSVQHAYSYDPKLMQLKVNQDFFDALIENLLHTQSFENVCKSSLFTHYLESI